MPESLSFLVDASGKKIAVLLPWSLWKRVEPLVQSVLESADESEDFTEPVAAFDEFLRYWDFHYPYSPMVHCPVCGSSTENWREDPEHPFLLVNANLGGLLVFRCKRCNTTIRQKHFKDHVALEHTKVRPDS